MNLSKLFQMQKELDDRIVEEKGLQGVDLLDKKILALLTELGELSNEYRGFKFWSEDQEPRTDGKIYNTKTQLYEKGNPMLIEYVDCLHFILGIGNDLGVSDLNITCDYTEKTITKTFIMTHLHIGDLAEELNYSLKPDKDNLKYAYHGLGNIFINLGEMLGFTTDQIEQAYLDKNEENHRRQEDGY